MSQEEFWTGALPCWYTETHSEVRFPCGVLPGVSLLSSQTLGRFDAFRNDEAKTTQYDQPVWPHELLGYILFKLMHTFQIRVLVCVKNGQLRPVYHSSSWSVPGAVEHGHLPLIWIYWKLFTARKHVLITTLSSRVQHECFGVGLVLICVLRAGIM